MAGANDNDSIAAGSAQRVLRLLDALRQNEAGIAIYRQVERMLSDMVGVQSGIEQAYAAIASSLLDACSRQLPNGSPLLVNIRLLQSRLQPPLGPSELSALQEYTEEYSIQLADRGRLDMAVLEEALSPLLSAFGMEPVSSASYPGTYASHNAHNQGEGFNDEYFSQEESRSHGPATLKRESPDLPTAEEVEARQEGMMVQHHIRELQEGLAHQVLDTISQNQEFGVLLEVVNQELHQASDSNQLEDLRWTLIREIERLRGGHKELADKLDQTHQHLQLLESDSRQLSDELTRVRLLSLTDELTGLSNRRAFLRRLEDEVARVQRYGFPLSLALIDLDNFKLVNDEYGHAAGDEVLRVYANNILSIFRHHDLVARYGGEEFAVLLPNTDIEGSTRALNKVRERCRDTNWDLEGEQITVPTFSAGLALYKPGETSSDFIERVDKALYRAKRLGRDRVELDTTYQIGAVKEAGGEPAE